MLKRLPDFVSWIICCTILTLTVQVVVGDWIWLGVSFMPMLLLIEALSRSPRFLGYMVGRGHTLAVWIASVAVLASLSCIIYINLTRALVLPAARHWVASLIIGTLLGIMLRQSLENVYILGVTGKKRQFASIFLYAIWAALVVVFPWGEGEYLQCTYSFGVGLGVLIHKGSRLRWSNWLSDLSKTRKVDFPPDIPATKWEMEALTLLKRKKFRKLKNKLKQWEKYNETLPLLSLIRASYHRLSGEHKVSLEVAQVAISAFDDPGKDTKNLFWDFSYAYLKLLEVMALRELDKEEMSEYALEQSISKIGSKCPVAHINKALELAERRFKDIEHVTTDKEALVYAQKASDFQLSVIKKREQANKTEQDVIDAFLSRLIEIGVPVNRSFFLDILGYAHLAAGYQKEARLILGNCIVKDPKYSYAYLHLGDYFLFRTILLLGKTRPTEKDIWHAKACYFAVLNIENKKSSRVVRLAQERLNYIASDFPRKDQEPPSDSAETSADSPASVGKV